MNLTYLKIVPKWRSSGMKLFDKIRILRKARGLSQEQLGYSLSRVNKDGISRQTVSDWENGKFEPKLENIRDLAEVFNVSFDALLDESVDLENEKVLEAVLNKKPYDKKELEDDIYFEPKKEVKDKRMTSWRTAILMALAAYIIYIGINYLFNLVSILTEITKDSTGYQTIVIIYSLCILTFFGFGGSAFGIGLNSIIRGNEAKKSVFVLVMLGLSFFACLETFMGVSSLVSTIQQANAKRSYYYGSETKEMYLRMIPGRVITLLHVVISSLVLIFIAIFANKKFARKEPFQQY